MPPSIRAIATRAALMVAAAAGVACALTFLFDAWLPAPVFVAAVATLAGFVAAAWAARHVADPLRAVEQVARDVSSGARERRAPVIGPRECREVAAAINDLLDALSHTAEENQALALYMQRLSRHALALRALERRAIAAELHDQVGQQLAAAQLTIRAVRSACSAVGAPAAEAARPLASVETLLQSANERTRKLLTRLRPPLLDEYGIVPALRSHARQMAERGSRLAVSVVQEGPELRLEGVAEGIVFEVLTEALHNAEKHSGADAAFVTVRAREDEIEFLVHDDGCGFDPTAPREASWGISTMRERIRDIGGSFELRSEPGVGTDLRIAILRRTAGVQPDS